MQTCDPQWAAAVSFNITVSFSNIMAVRRFSVVVPKRGVQRFAQKNPATKKPAAYTKIDYVREKAAVASRGVHQEQMKSKRSLPELLKASDDEIIEMLLADGMLPDWTGKQCPRCDKGRLSKLIQHPGRSGLRHRCSRKHCQVYISPTHLRPWFTDQLHRKYFLCRPRRQSC